MLKFLFFLPFVFLISNSYGATCTNTTRTNYTSNQVLTSSALNADFNQLVTKANALDGGCVTDGTLEYTALDSSLDAVKNGIHQGCTLAYSDANTVSIGKCILSVSGKFVKTTVATTVTWGGASSAEVVSTLYYIYALTTSSGTTLNLLISTVAPGVDGYDVSGNKVLGRFYNNSSSAIDSFSIESWAVGGFTKQDGQNTSPGVTGPVTNFSFSFGASSISVCSTGTCAYLDQIGNIVTSVAYQSAGNYLVTFANAYSKIKCTGIGTGAGGALILSGNAGGSGNTMTLFFVSSGTTGVNALATINCVAI